MRGIPQHESFQGLWMDCVQSAAVRPRQSSNKRETRAENRGATAYMLDKIACVIDDGLDP